MQNAYTLQRTTPHDARKYNDGQFAEWTDSKFVSGLEILQLAFVPHWLIFDFPFIMWCTFLVTHGLKPKDLPKIYFLFILGHI